MSTDRLTLWGILIRAVVVHTITYTGVGILAFTVFDYTGLFSEPGLRGLMRPTDDPLVMAGPLFQPIRGAMFGVVFYLFREQYFGRKHGWLTMWVALVVLGIFSTFGPSPGSVDGLIYTTLPVSFQLGGGLIEVLGQSVLLSFLVFYWVNHPEKRWLTWTFAVGFTIALVLPALGLLLGQGGAA